MDDFTYQPPLEPWLQTVHLDRDLIVIDKPPGLLSVPGRGADRLDSVLTRVRRDHPGALDVHRLDLDTSGLLVVALRRKAERELKRQFRERLVHKLYLARVWGHMDGEAGQIDLPLGPDPALPLRHRVDPEAGRPASTAWRVRSRDAHTTLLELRPSTGRSHQLRVHLEAVGHPILGDRFYAPPAVLALAPRLCLHAAWISLLHPFSGERLEFAAALPAFALETLTELQ